jgi:hypothetical protein
MRNRQKRGLLDVPLTSYRLGMGIAVKGLCNLNVKMSVDVAMLLIQGNHAANAVWTLCTGKQCGACGLDRLAADLCVASRRP